MSVKCSSSTIIDQIFLQHAYYPKEVIKHITLVQAIIRKKLTKKKLKKQIASQAKRRNVCGEIFTTEESYFTSLESLISSYFEPLKEFKDLKEKKRLEIFGNISSIVDRSKSLLNTIRLQLFFNKQKQRLSEDQPIGSIFQKEVVPYLHMYRDYCASYDVSMAILTENKFDDPKSALNQFLKKCQEAHNVMDISSFLIMPVQRLTRYKLFFEELKKLTAVTSLDYDAVLLVLDRISEVAVTANTLLKERQNAAMFAALQKRLIGKNVPTLAQANRFLLNEGQLSKICRKEVKDRYFILLTDLLLYGSEQMNLLNIHRVMSLTNTKILDLPDNPQREYKNALQISSQSKSFVVTAETSIEKRRWLEKYREALKQMSALNMGSSTLPPSPIIPSSSSSEIPNLPPIPQSTNTDSLSAIVSPKNSRKTMFIGSGSSTSSAIASHLGQSSTQNPALPEGDYLAPVWQPDSSQNNCTYCRTLFTVFRRRHHCRNCGALVCGPCSEQKFQLPIGLKRVCTECYGKLSGQITTAQRRRSTISKPGTSVEKLWQGVTPTSSPAPQPLFTSNSNGGVSNQSTNTLFGNPSNNQTTSDLQVDNAALGAGNGNVNASNDDHLAPVSPLENGEFLPYHLFYNLLSYFEVKELLNSMLVCRYWARIIKVEAFWEYFLPSRFPFRNSVRRLQKPRILPLEYITSPPLQTDEGQNHNFEELRRCHISTLNWRNKRYTKKRTLVGHTEPVNALCYSDGDGGMDNVASASNDGTIRLWSLSVEENIDPLKAVFTTSTPSGPVRALQVWWSGKRLYSGGKDKTVRVWDISTGQVISRNKTINGPLGISTVLSLSFDTDWNPHILAAAYQEGHVLVWDLRARSDTPAHAFHHYHADQVYQSSDTLLSNSTKKKSGFLFPIHLRDGRLVSGGPDGSLRLWSCRMAEGGEGRRTKSLYTVKSGNSPIDCLSFDDRHLVAGSRDAKVFVWSTSSKESILLNGHTKGVSCLQLGGTKLVTGSRDETVKVWKLEPKEKNPSYLEQTYHCKNKKDSNKTAKTRTISFGDNRLVAGCSDFSLRVWDFL